jgi:lambda family phage portal protein
MTATVTALSAARAVAPWYNAERVAQPGSVVLQQWRKAHGPEARRVAAAAATSKRSYAGAQFGRRTSDWIALSTSSDSELFTSLRTLRNRHRQMGRDNEYVSNYLTRTVPDNVIGTGIGFQAQVMMRRGGRLDEKINDAIEQAWARWGRADSCHTAGRLSFPDMERLILRNVPESGEILVRMVKKRFGRSKVPFALEIIEADQLVDNWSGFSHKGREVRMGVEVDEWQRPVAYWLYPRHPGDYSFALSAPSNQWQRVPAEEVIHIGLFERPYQTRCVPWLHSALIKLRDSGGYEEAEIFAARAAAMIMGFFESPEVDLANPDAANAGDGTQDGEEVYDMSPGVIRKMAPGEKFTGFSPNRPNTGAEAFLRHLMRSAAQGAGVSYATWTGDYSQTNYSSSRLAILSERDHWRAIQQWIIRTFHQRVYEAWLEMAVLSGELNLPAFETTPEIYQAVRWKPRGWDWVDPYKEVQAARLAVRSGLQTLTDAVAAKGGDIEDLFKQRRRELDLAAQYDLVLETDPAQTDDKGAVQPLSPVAETDTGLDADGDPIPGGGDGPQQTDSGGEPPDPTDP